MRVRRIGLLLAFALVFQAGSSEAATPPSRPKLVLAILVDQLRYDYLERFHDQFGENGFRMLTDRGAYMTFARYDYMPTVTAPGHASFFSGAPPAIHGIIANEWFDKRTGKMQYCVGDASVSAVGIPPKAESVPKATPAPVVPSATAAPATPPAVSTVGRMSPRNFIGSNFSDQMRLHYQSKVVAISMKDRGAILPGGKKPAGAFWWDSASGNFITSTYYMPALPAWVQQFNARERAPQFIGQKWTRLLEPKAYERADNLPGEGTLEDEKTPTFDHTVTLSKTEGYENIMPTPYGNQLLLEFALAALEGEHLGQGPQPDVLCVSFSSVDYCGHRFGPYSQEVQDIVLRLDKQLAELFAAVDQKVGLNNVAIVMTADHGVAPAPEFASSVGLDGSRVDTVKLMGDLVEKLSARFGTSKVLQTPKIVEGNIYFNHELLRDQKIAPAELAGFIRDWALATGYFQACYSREQILDGRTPGEIGERVRNGFHAERSGDVVLLFKPFILTGTAKNGTTHDTPYSYDTRVPVAFYGPAFLPGRYADDFRITDIAPTLAAALHILEPSGSIGRPLVKVLAEQAGNAPATADRPR